MERPDERDWLAFTERVGNEAVFWVVQWIGGEPYVSSEAKLLDGDRAEFAVPVLGVMPLLDFTR